MELWDAYDKNENKLGIDIERGAWIAKGMYHLVCEILVQHKDGNYLVMQRDWKKESWPGRFEGTAGGSALKGENPRQCALRELKEETGIEVNTIKEIYHEVTERSIHHGFYCITDCPKDSVILQEGETIRYKWLTPKKFRELVESEQFVPTQRQRLRPFLSQTE